jgi:hypothetical protein
VLSQAIKFTQIMLLNAFYSDADATKAVNNFFNTFVHWAHESVESTNFGIL